MITSITQQHAVCIPVTTTSACNICTSTSPIIIVWGGAREHASYIYHTTRLCATLHELCARHTTTSCPCTHAARAARYMLQIMPMGAGSLQGSSCWTTATCFSQATSSGAIHIEPTRVTSACLRSIIGFSITQCHARYTSLGGSYVWAKQIQCWRPCWPMAITQLLCSLSTRIMR